MSRLLPSCLGWTAKSWVSTSMMTASMPQALKLWSELWRAYYQRNGFGGDTAEVYAFTLLPYFTVWDTERAEEASSNLRSLLVEFKEQSRAIIEVDGKDFTPSTPIPPERHRWHIKVTSGR